MTTLPFFDTSVTLLRRIDDGGAIFYRVLSCPEASVYRRAESPLEAYGDAFQPTLTVKLPEDGMTADFPLPGDYISLSSLSLDPSNAAENGDGSLTYPAASAEEAINAADWHRIIVAEDHRGPVLPHLLLICK